MLFWKKFCIIKNPFWQYCDALWAVKFIIDDKRSVQGFKESSFYNIVLRNSCMKYIVINFQRKEKSRKHEEKLNRVKNFFLLFSIVTHKPKTFYNRANLFSIFSTNRKKKIFQKSVYSLILPFSISLLTSLTRR